MYLAWKGVNRSISWLEVVTMDINARKTHRCCVYNIATAVPCEYQCYSKPAINGSVIECLAFCLEWCLFYHFLATMSHGYIYHVHLHKPCALTRNNVTKTQALSIWRYCHCPACVWKGYSDLDIWAMIFYITKIYVIVKITGLYQFIYDRQYTFIDHICWSHLLMWSSVEFPSPPIIIMTIVGSTMYVTYLAKSKYM